MILVIGYGNTLRGDDGIGPVAAQGIAQVACRHEAETIVCHQLTPDLAEPISRASRVIFIDAAEGGPPGRIVSRAVYPEPAAGAFTHQTSPESLLTGARLLYGRAPEAILITVTGASFDFSTELSPTLEAALPELIEYVRQAIEAPLSAHR